MAAGKSSISFAREKPTLKTGINCYDADDNFTVQVEASCAHAHPETRIVFFSQAWVEATQGKTEKVLNPLKKSAEINRGSSQKRGHVVFDVSYSFPS